MDQYRPASLAAALFMAAVTATGSASAQTDRFDALANAPFKENRPTPETAKTLVEELAFEVCGREVAGCR